MKSAGPASDLTVLVFKDNSTARTFRVPIGWLSRLGFFAGIVSAIAVLGIFLSLKYYYTARVALKTADPAYVQDLEQEIASLRAAKNSTQAAAPSAPTTSASSGVAQPLPTVTVTVAPSAPGATRVTSPLAFSALPSDVEAPPTTEEIPIKIHEPVVEWQGRTLRVGFFIQYIKEDKGSQQGRIVLLARGPDTLLAYPSGVLNPSNSNALIAPDKGEYFSVSRVREVKADFGPMKSASALKTVEVFLFNSHGGLLVHQILTPADHDSGTSQ